MTRRVAAALVVLAAVGCGADPEPAPATTTTATAAPATTIPGGDAMQLTSTAFTDGGVIPTRFTCDGNDVSPPLEITGTPEGTAVLVLVMDDPDAPVGTWDHWVAYDIPPVAAIAEGDDDLGTAGVNSWGRAGYGGPCPPSGEHRYFFRVYAVDAPLELDEGAGKEAVLTAIEGRVLAEATLLGRYSR